MKGLPEEATSSFEIRVLPDPEEAALATALELAHAAADAVGNRGIFRLALSGGTTPARLYRRLADRELRVHPDWNRTQFFFVDERCVPPEDGRSNYRLAKELLFDPLAIPAERVFRMRGEEDPETAASKYQNLLASELGGTDSTPRFDCVLLGLGADGHTASLFPGTRALLEDRRRVVANWVPQLTEWRLTVTLPVLNAARRAVFLVTGPEKREVVAMVAEKKTGSRDLPASLVRPPRGSLVWILDEAAAADL